MRQQIKSFQQLDSGSAIVHNEIYVYLIWQAMVVTLFAGTDSMKLLVWVVLKAGTGCQYPAAVDCSPMRFPAMVKPFTLTFTSLLEDALLMMTNTSRR